MAMMSGDDAALIRWAAPGHGRGWRGTAAVQRRFLTLDRAGGGRSGAKI